VSDIELLKQYQSNFHKFYWMLATMLLEERTFGLSPNLRMFFLPSMHDIASSALELVIYDGDPQYTLKTHTFLWLVNYGGGWRIDECWDDRDTEIKFLHMTPEVIAQVQQRLIGLLENYARKLNELSAKT
jgi:hypothetical protein